MIRFNDTYICNPLTTKHTKEICSLNDLEPESTGLRIKYMKDALRIGLVEPGCACRARRTIRHLQEQI